MHIKVLQTISSAIALVTLAACSSSTEGVPGPNMPPESAENASIVVGTMALATAAPLYSALAEGYFEEEGLDVQIQVLPTSPALVAAVTSGEVQFGFSATGSVLLAQAQGLEISAVSGGTMTDLSDPQVPLLVRGDAGISSPADLAGKQVAVSELGGQSQYSATAAIESAGGDPSLTQFIALPIPDMAVALTSGRVDAAVTVQPFTNQAIDAGHLVLVDDLYNAIHPNFTVITWFGGDDYMDSNPAVAQKFSRAMKKSSEHLMGDREAFNQIVPTYTKIDAAGAKALPFPANRGTVNLTAVGIEATQMRAYGLLPADIDVEQFVHESVRDIIVEE